MKAIIMSVNGTKTNVEIELPIVFETPLRKDVIKRAVLAEQSWNRQPKGVSPLAGRLVSVENWGPGRGAARVPRTKGTRTHSAQRGAFVPQARGGHKAHPPKSTKNIIEKINKKEHLLALKSSIAFTALKDAVRERGHRFNDAIEFPIIVEEKAEEISKTKDAIKLLNNLGVGADLERVKNGRRIRPGKGKMRGRRYKTPVGPLIIVGSDDSPILKAARNVLGVDVKPVNKLKTELLAPGADPGRLTIWTEKAVAYLNEKYR
ncbi:MAG: 50S ribosomal protein L4 [Candidatus Heimdallarchaeum endolithica]|uniref:Large ribosomal subunit protein uL4 n=1 Tax=Candidatus Heimdallarchaeum endolithica TaxID=2876572 RepID=A0A9Y1BP88_9ARCH|nr:MAG: 50S ribosomal protein L4 [Candidatus Heimdallarchaeum endolithica]